MKNTNSTFNRAMLAGILASTGGLPLLNGSPRQPYNLYKVDFSGAEKRILAMLNGKEKKLYVQELKTKYFEARREQLAAELTKNQ